jgi:hypothetical protein
MRGNEIHNGQMVIRSHGFTAAWPWRLIIFSFLLFLISLTVYGALVFGYRPDLEKKIVEHDAELAELARVVPEAEQKRFLTFYAQLVNLKEALSEHVVSTSVFSWLESHTNANVFFNTVNLDTSARELTLAGIAESFEVLAEQLEIFRTASELERYFITQSQHNFSGRIQFRVGLIFKEDLFRF